jgi:1-deoxy-D-xylulose-5-phosphate synthase
MLADAASHPAVITAEDGLREGGVGSAIRDRIGEAAGPTPAMRVLGTPVAYIPHGNAEVILSELGLDAAGIAASARALLAGETTQ